MSIVQKRLNILRQERELFVIRSIEGCDITYNSDGITSYLSKRLEITVCAFEENND